MLVVVSDLHLQHVALDAVKYVRSGVVRESGVRRNVAEGALQMLFTDVLGLAERAQSREIELVFDGDIFELLRTPLWFSRNDADLCPTTAELGPDSPDNRLLTKVHEILDAVVADNRGFFQALSRFVREGRYEPDGRASVIPPGVALRVHYVPGNHDRLANAWPSVRRRVRELLSMESSDAPFPHVIDKPQGAGYGVRIRHGHEYDPSNIGVHVPFGPPITLSDADYLAPCLGDYVAVEVALRLSLAFRVLYAEPLHADDERGRALREFYGSLVEFDDVRPATLLIMYLAKHLSRHGMELFELLRPVLLDLYLTAVSSPFVQTMANRLALMRYISAPVVALVREAIQNLSPGTLEDLVKRVQQLDTSSDTNRGAAMASTEEGLAEGHFDFIVAGHTHNPDVVPLPAPQGSAREPFFLDTGTWRTSIRHGVANAFGRLRACSVVVIYSDEERAHFSDKRRFETWTGHLAGATFGPYDVAVGPLGPVRRRARVVALRIVRVDEGQTSDGAEIRIHWGVDGYAQVVFREHLHDGERVELDAPFVDVHDELDGEIWAYGHEVDRGEGALIDADDPLPWAVGWLARDEQGHFALGRGELPMRRYEQIHVIVEYEVVLAAMGGPGVIV